MALAKKLKILSLITLIKNQLIKIAVLYKITFFAIFIKLIRLAFLVIYFKLSNLLFLLVYLQFIKSYKIILKRPTNQQAELNQERGCSI